MACYDSGSTYDLWWTVCWELDYVIIVRLAYDGCIWYGSFPGFFTMLQHKHRHTQTIYTFPPNIFVWLVVRNFCK